MISDDDKQKFLDELRKTALVSNACAKSGIARANVYRWRDEDPEFKAKMEDAVSDGRNLMNDVGESVIIGKMKEKDLKAAQYYLGHNHPQYMHKDPHGRYLEAQKAKIPSQSYSAFVLMGALKFWHKLFGDRPFPSESEIEAMEEPPTPPSALPTPDP
jgi:hypothetical protein